MKLPFSSEHPCLGVTFVLALVWQSLNSSPCFRVTDQAAAMCLLRCGLRDAGFASLMTNYWPPSVSTSQPPLFSLYSGVQFVFEFFSRWFLILFIFSWISNNLLLKLFLFLVCFKSRFNLCILSVISLFLAFFFFLYSWNSWRVPMLPPFPSLPLPASPPLPPPPSLPPSPLPHYGQLSQNHLCAWT